ncbi:WD repeat-containing protein 43, partial [Trifolium pratense]
MVFRGPTIGGESKGCVLNTFSYLFEQGTLSLEEGPGNAPGRTLSRRFSKCLNSYFCQSGLELEAAVEKESKKSKKRQATSDPDLPTTTEKVDFDQCEAAEGVLDDDPSEPTMGEKLAGLNLLDENKSKSEKEQESLVSLKPPSADSVHILLKQALNADDR